MRSLLSLCVLALNLPAHAVVYAGNPVITLQLDHPNLAMQNASVWLEEVRIHRCDGTVLALPVDEAVDLVAGVEVDAPPGDYCALTLVWDSAVEGEGGLPPGSIAWVYEHPSTHVDLGVAMPPVDLAPYTVLDGSMALPARLHVSIED